MEILLVENSNEATTKGKIASKENRLKIETIDPAKEGLEIFKKKNFDIVISDYELPESNAIQVLRNLREIGEDIPVLILEGSCREREEKDMFLNQIFTFPSIIKNQKIGGEKIHEKDIEILSEKESFKSAFTEVWRFGNYVSKIKEGGIKEAKKRRKYQLELREKLDFLPKYYGMLVTKNDDKEIVMNFYEYIEPLKTTEIGIEDLKKILGIIEKSYEQGYHGIDIKHSNFGKENGKIYYLDEEGIGKYVPHDWTELMRKFLNRINNRK